MLIPEDIRAAIEFIHSSDYKFSIATAGAGSLAVSWLLAIPGASNSILDVRIPYHGKAMEDFLGYMPTKFVSDVVSKEMADRAFLYSRKYANDLNSGHNLIGIGCTASIATNKPKRGDHNFFLSASDGLSRLTIHVILAKDTRSREEEEEVVSRSIINAISAECHGTAIGIGTNINDKFRLF